ncbi:uncharacterized protein LOC103316234 [Nasonia vitripennis]|uniref:C2H2-type domain-containing protein n=1 Tax=Nasonia vitripennis TaxID=7425 RepID=A0A7M7H460_NASVI|nr:uncharacterized protein LOC103316234 [Nasonia vitripennis]
MNRSMIALIKIILDHKIARSSLISNNHKFNRVKTIKKKITFKCNDSSFVENDGTGRKRRSDLVADYDLDGLDSDDHSAISIYDSDLEEPCVREFMPELTTADKSMVQSTNTTVQNWVNTAAIESGVQPTAYTSVNSAHSFNREDAHFLSSSLDSSNVSNVDAANGEKKKKRKRVVAIRNLYAYHCIACKQNFKKINRLKKTHCDNCESELLLQCLTCHSNFKNYNNVYSHLRDNHALVWQRNRDKENDSNVLNKSLPRSSGILEQANSSKVDESIPSVAERVMDTTPAINESKSAESMNKEEICPTCGEIRVNESTSFCFDEKIFRCYSCVTRGLDFRCCHQNTLQRHIATEHKGARRVLHSKADYCGQ